MGVFKRRSFRVDILTAFVTLLLITFLTIIIYNYRSSSRIVLMLCGDLMEKTTQIVINKTTGFLQDPADLTELIAQLLSNNISSIDSQTKLERLTIACLNSQPQIAMFLIGDRMGNFISAKPGSDGGFATKYINRQVNPPLTTWKFWNKDFQVIRTETNTTDLYDPRLRPWFQGAEAQKGIYWTDLYIFYTGKKPGITVSHPVMDSKGNVTGVTGCDIEMVKLSDFLQSLKIGKNGLVFIMNEKKELVAFTDPKQIMVDPGETGVLQPYRVDSLDNRIVVAAYREYIKKGRKEFAVTLSGERYRASFTAFPPSFGKPWQVGVVVPENDFIGEVNELTRRVLFICLVFLGLSVLMAVLLARRISRPILRLAEETDKIRNLQLDEPLDLRSRITEIEILSQAINRMKVSLRSFLRFAPQQLVQEVILGGKELMLGGDRREVTLLFSDLRNFTHFAEQTKPEDVVQILNVHFDAMVRIISDHGGYVVDFLGDSLFALFGAPQRNPDHAFQAIKCAVTMQLTRQRLNRELAAPDLPRLEMGIGINSGSCVVGNMGSQVRIKYGVVGHAVNLAARIETFSVGGQVLVSEASRRLVEGRVSVIGPYQAYGKGVEGAILIWEARGLYQDADLTLPPTVPGLTPLLQSLPVSFRLITGKQIARELYQAKITKLSSDGAALATDFSLDDFAAIQIELTEPTAKKIHLDGKVVGSDEAEQVYIIRFSPLDDEVIGDIAHILSG